MNRLVARIYIRLGVKSEKINGVGFGEESNPICFAYDLYRGHQMEYLLSVGADYKYGRIMTDGLEIAKMLIEYGIDVDYMVNGDKGI